MSQPEAVGMLWWAGSPAGGGARKLSAGPLLSQFMSECNQEGNSALRRVRRASVFAVRTENLLRFWRTGPDEGRGVHPAAEVLLPGS